jgi:hypothetical protein
MDYLRKSRVLKASSTPRATGNAPGGVSFTEMSRIVVRGNNLREGDPDGRHPFRRSIKKRDREGYLAEPAIFWFVLAFVAAVAILVLSLLVRKDEKPSAHVTIFLA